MGAGREALAPRAARSRTRAAAPRPRPSGGTIVSVGGESPAGTHAAVYGFDVATGRWRRLPDLPTPRHGLGAVTFAGRVYVIGGGPQPGLTVTGANEVLSGLGP